MFSSKSFSERSLLLLLAMFIFVLTGCNLVITPSDSPFPTSDPFFSDELLPPKSVTVLLSLIIPSPLPKDEAIFVELLDEVSGLYKNPERYQLDPVDERHYQAELEFLAGSEIKYRYLRVGAEEIPEITAFNTPVRYRMFSVTSGYQIKDRVAAWQSEPYDGAVGRMYGTVLDDKTGHGIPDVLVAVAGYQTHTDFSGRFVIDGLISGVHTLVAYAIDGSYQTFQQGVNIIEGLSTPAPIRMLPLPEVEITFVVMPPNDAVGAPIRFAGNLYQLGNTFADLSGCPSALASRMPLLTQLEDGRYSITLKLHAGNYLEYKYTLGDGCINAERNLEGEPHTRKIILPDADITVEEQIMAWRAPDIEPIPIRVTVPADTPAVDSISLQLKDGNWLQPVPMWPMGNYQWLYLLFSPRPESNHDLQIRFCRNDHCQAIAQNGAEEGVYDLGRGAQIVIDSWSDWQPIADTSLTIDSPLPVRDLSYLTGIEFLSLYHPSFQNRYDVVFSELKQLDANWLILTPTWVVNNNMNSPHLEPLTGSSPLMHDLLDMLQLADKYGLKVALFPQLDFGENSDQWWHATDKTALWWQEWFVEYERFLDNYAKLANNYGVDKMIIGGDQVAYTLPGAIPNTDEVVGTPSNAESLWRTILKTIKAGYSGSLLWALPFTEEQAEPPAFLDQVDGIYLLFDRNLVDPTFYGDPYGYRVTAAAILDDQVYQLKTDLDKPLYIGLSYPSASGAAEACVLDSDDDCRQTLLTKPYDPDISSEVALQEQADIYNALCQVIMERDWIDGIVSRGFYTPAKLTDSASSVYGKPAMQVLRFWYSNIK